MVVPKKNSSKFNYDLDIGASFRDGVYEQAPIKISNTTVMVLYNPVIVSQSFSLLVVGTLSWQKNIKHLILFK